MKRVLVADDNVANLALITEILEGRGFEVQQAPNGQEALEMIAGNPPDIVFLDIQMPHLDGYSVLRKLRALPAVSYLPVVALTASAMKGDREKAIAGGFDAYLAKPYDIGEVVSLIGRLTDRAQGGAN